MYFHFLFFFFYLLTKRLVIYFIKYQLKIFSLKFDLIWVPLYQYKTKFYSFETNWTLWFDGVIEDEYLKYIEDCKQIVKIADSRFKKSKSQKFLWRTSSLREFFSYPKTRWKQENLSIIEQIRLESLFPAKEAKSSSSLFLGLLKVEPTRMKKFTA